MKTVTREELDRAFHKEVQDFCDRENLGDHHKLDLDNPRFVSLRFLAATYELMNRRLFGPRV